MNRKTSTLWTLAVTLALLWPGAAGWSAEGGTSLTRNGPWQAHDMRQEPTRTRFWVRVPTPMSFARPVDLPLARVKGILWELSIADGTRHFPMQLFWQTQRLQWSEARSFRFTAPAYGAGVHPLRFL